MKPYPYTAKSVSNLDPVEVIKGAAWTPGERWPPPEAIYSLPDSVVAQCIIDASYCLDAPETLPAGGCRGILLSPDLPSGAAQLEVRRGAA